ncbi:MAG: L-aspartate oxidase [Arenicellales bacterium]
MTANRRDRVLVVGAGLAGLSLALRLSHQGIKVTVLAKKGLTEGSSLYAQGGIAAALSRRDSFESHIQDTLDAGAGLCNREAVDFIVRHGPENIQWLIDQGVEFSRFTDENRVDEYHLTREGGHSHRRVIHSRDATGKAVETTLEGKVRRDPNITVLENHIAVDVINSRRPGVEPPTRCLGVYALDLHSGMVNTLAADFVVLATGGASKAYLYTSNPDTSTGDGIAMAWRSGCRVVDMEFVQFHPTCLFHPRAKTLLISEAVRGEGGKLSLPDGTEFMASHDPRAELAPRDIVARAIDYEMKRHGVEHVNLDISHKPPEFVREHFPTLYEVCKRYGYDMTREPIPVVPAAHYTCGGVMTDLRGRSDLPGLYAIGECSWTGLHGANRLASNSLLECLVLAQSACADILQQGDRAGAPRMELAPWDESLVTDPDEQIVVSHNWDELRRFMWDYVGIVRTTKRLQRARHRINLLKEEIRDYYSNFRVGNDLVELRNLLTVAELTVLCALERRESRGLHYTLDYPAPDDSAYSRDTVLTPKNFVGRLHGPVWEDRD